MKKPKISPYVSDQTIKFLQEVHMPMQETPTGMAAYWLEAVAATYRRECHELKKLFSEAEKSLMIDVMNGCMLSPGLAGQHLTANCEDGIELDRLDEKWKIDAEKFLKKLNALTPAQLMMLEVWAVAFWSGEVEKKGALEGYIK